MIHVHRYLLTAVAAVAALAVLVPAAGAGTTFPPAPAVVSPVALTPAQTTAQALTPALTPAPTPAPVSDQVLNLKDALTLAEKHSLQLQVAALQVPKARIALDRWKAAGATGGSALALGLQMRYGVSLPSDDTTAAALRRSYENTLEQAALGLEVARQSLRLAVTKAYVEWQKADALVAAQQAALTRAQAQAELAGKALAAGTAAHYDVVQAGAQVSAQKAAVAAAQAGRDTARLTLERLAGSPLNPGLRPEPPDPEPSSTLDPATPEAPAPDPAEDLIEKALKQRPDVAAGKLTVQAREADLDMLGQYFPADDPIVAGARLAIQEAALNLEATQADIRLQVQQSLLVIASARERLAALADGEAQSREALRLAQLRFEAGTATSVEVVGADAAVSGATAAHIQALADLAAARATLQQAIGDL